MEAWEKARLMLPRQAESLRLGRGLGRQLSLSSCGMWSTSLSEEGPMSTVDPNSWLSYAPAEV